ncbi:hypothetical protein [Agromyces mariniharenae]|uniref:hypothetical protein n=1 Tax=Agromyces mariniharenae TaxID=2604423 RepID=UPI0016533044|nr:hypothetical protein [Agromyces mariniharenae]
MTDINTPPDGDAVDRDPKRPADEASSWDIQPPPIEDGVVPGVPDASEALDEGTDDGPGTNASGVGA